MARELEVIMKLDHPNIVRFYETYQDKKYLHIVMEYCSGGELLNRIIDKGNMNEDEARNIMKKIFSVIKYIHEKGVVHRDLKLENFLFSDKSEAAEIKLIDFGLSRTFDYSNTLRLDSVVGTPFYVAPEILTGNYDYRCDYWSLGVIMYILLSG